MEWSTVFTGKLQDILSGLYSLLIIKITNPQQHHSPESLKVMILFLF